MSHALENSSEQTNIMLTAVCLQLAVASQVCGFFRKSVNIKICFDCKSLSCSFLSQVLVSASVSRNDRQVDRSDALLSGASSASKKIFDSNPSSVVHPPTGTKTRKTYDFTSQ